MKAREIKDLIDFISRSGMDEVHIETEEFKVSVKRSAPVQGTAPAAPAVLVSPPAAPAVAAPAAAAPVAAPSPVVEVSKHVAIKSPMIGTFYATPNPESPAFVKVGDTVAVGQTVCIIEAMKLFNEIESDVAGTVVKIMVDNSSPVEFDQPLFLVDPS
ncbi:MAG: acetyl-CoA carboxylase biotin carboxyl carrier protein [Cytophagales bacterium]|nr:acetyl-CoA carboxylase biotin carboxyl carrier protein [Cytophagales bacterium]